MADPTKYKPHFNYSGWEAAGSKRPKPGAELDTDFANIERSIDETIDALKDIRRSDGKLKNGIVDKDALDESARELWESAETAAENAKGSAQSAAGSAASAGRSAEAARGYASDAVSQGNVPIYASVATVEGLNINPNLTAIRTNGYYTPGDGGGALYVVGDEGPGAIQSGDGRWWNPDCTRGVWATQFGLRCDGVADDADAFEYLVQYLVNVADSGIRPVLLFPSKGHVRLTRGVDLSVPGLIMRCNGTLFEHDSTDRLDPLFTIDNPQDVLVEDGVFDGRADLKNAGYAGTQRNHAFQLRNFAESTSAHFTRNTFKRFLNHTILHKAEYGVDPNEVTRGFDFQVYGNKFIECGNPALSPVGGSCVMTFAGNSRTYIANNYFLNCANGIKVDSTARGRAALLNTNPGVTDWNEWSGYDHIIVNNRFRVDSDLGIVSGEPSFATVQGCQRVVVSGNVIDCVNSEYHQGIRVNTSQDFAPCRDILVVDNIFNVWATGVLLYQVESVTVARNIIKKPSGAEDALIYVWNTDAQDPDHPTPYTIINKIYIDDNELTAPDGRVIWLRNQGSDAERFKNLFLRRNVVFMSDPSNVSQKGITAVGPLKGIHIIDNTITGGYEGIYCNSDVQSANIRNNVVIDCDTGISVLDSSSGVLAFNDAAECETPFAIRSDQFKLIFNNGSVTTSGATQDVYIALDGSTIRLGRTSADMYKHAILFGSGFYLWIDSDGKVRTKSGAPTSDTDGTVVGTQT